MEQHWNAGGNGSLKAWFVDVADDQRDAELGFLQNEIYHREIDLPMRRIDAYNRFSSRV